MAAAEHVNRLRVALLTALILGACDRSKQPEASEKRTRGPSGQPPATGSAPAVWDDTFGAVVATPSVENNTPTLFMRDTAASADIDVELFSHDAQAVRATLHPTTLVHGCAWQRFAALSVAEPRAGPPIWSLALAPGLAMPVAIDGVGELLPRDSAALVARISRLVSALPDDSASAPFRGLPIVVRDAWRFQMPDDSAVIVVAIARRTLNVESNPRSEAITIIAEPDRSTGVTEWHTVFARRDAGPEDRIEGTDLLAALRLRNTHGAVALVRESETGSQIEIVERVAPAAWRVRWSSAALSCER